MKKFLLSTLLIGSLAAEETLLSFSHTFQTHLIPDRISAALDLGFRHTDSHTAKRNAQEALKLLSAAQGLCTGGAVGLRPEYRHHEGRSERIGFVASISLHCQSSDAEAIDRVITQAQEATARFDGELSLQAPRRIISTDQRLNAQTRLESEAIGWAARRLSTLAAQFAQRSCSLYEMRFEPASLPSVRMMAASANTLPLQSEEPLELTLHWSARCQ